MNVQDEEDRDSLYISLDHALMDMSIFKVSGFFRFAKITCPCELDHWILSPPKFEVLMRACRKAGVCGE